MAGQKDKAFDLFYTMSAQIDTSTATGKKQYNELVGILNKAGFGIPRV